jgi:hypothetical protein
VALENGLAERETLRQPRRDHGCSEFRVREVRQPEDRELQRVW